MPHLLVGDVSLDLTATVLVLGVVTRSASAAEQQAAVDDALADGADGVVLHARDVAHHGLPSRAPIVAVAVESVGDVDAAVARGAVLFDLALVPASPERLVARVLERGASAIVPPGAARSDLPPGRSAVAVHDGPDPRDLDRAGRTAALAAAIDDGARVLAVRDVRGALRVARTMSAILAVGPHEGTHTGPATSAGTR